MNALVWSIMIFESFFCSPKKFLILFFSSVMNASVIVFGLVRET